MVLTLGESVYDILIRNGTPMASVYGGSMFNVAVSLGRTGILCGFAGYYADDLIGVYSCDFLNCNGVDTSSFSKMVGAKSNLAIAFLNDAGVPKYSFYRDDQLLKMPDNISFNGVTHLVIGSFFVLNRKIFPEVKSIIIRSKNAGVQIIYDPNIRNKRVYEEQELLSSVVFFMQHADLVKVSDEDLLAITGHSELSEWKKFFDEINVQCYIITRGPKSIVGVEGNNEMFFEVAPVDVVSTVGAGDAFSAGILYALKAKHMEISALSEIIPIAEKFAAHVCASHDNYVSSDFIKYL